MNYIQNIDEASTNVCGANSKKWIITKPLEASGLLKWNIRIRKALAVLTGKADAFTYSDQ